MTELSLTDLAELEAKLRHILDKDDHATPLVRDALTELTALARAATPGNDSMVDSLRAVLAGRDPHVFIGLGLKHDWSVTTMQRLAAHAAVLRAFTNPPSARPDEDEQPAWPAESIIFEAPLERQRPGTPLEVGRTITGPALLPPVGALIVAQRGAGKSELLDVITTAASRRAHTVIWSAAVGGHLDEVWRDGNHRPAVVDRRAVNREEMVSMLRRAVALTQVRKNNRATPSRLVDDMTYPCEDSPALVLVIELDEASDEMLTAVSMLARTGPAYGVTVYASAPPSVELPAGFAANFAVRIHGVVPDPDALPDGFAKSSPQPQRPGEFIVTTRRDGPQRFTADRFFRGPVLAKLCATPTGGLVRHLPPAEEEAIDLYLRSGE